VEPVRNVIPFRRRASWGMQSPKLFTLLTGAF